VAILASNQANQSTAHLLVSYERPTNQRQRDRADGLAVVIAEFRAPTVCREDLDDLTV
jgi:hypothetical protein